MGNEVYRFLTNDKKADDLIYKSDFGYADERSTTAFF